VFAGKLQTIVFQNAEKQKSAFQKSGIRIQKDVGATPKTPVRRPEPGTIPAAQRPAGG
jgi:hypothetical protein